ncbi:MAG: acyltransferase [Pseudomonadaceae bacterium]|nr:acyltransferase [Pseudomonadaceae bacterium]
MPNTIHSTMSITPENFTNITLLRAVAALMVVYDHLFCDIPMRHFNMAAFPAPAIQEFITTPLGIIQDFGWIGVAIFFIISGFIITHVALRESQAEFLIKRIFRIYPPLIIAILLACAAAIVTSDKTYSTREILSAFTLTNYWQYPQTLILGVAWTLAVEIIFYLFTFMLLPLLKKKPAFAVAIQLIAICAIYILSKDYGHSFFLFSASAAYIPYLIIGQITYFLYSKLFSPQLFAAYLAASYAAVFYGIHLIHKSFAPVENSYLINFVYAYFVFAGCLMLKERIEPGRLIRAIADCSYSIYLLHGTIGITFILLISRHYNLDSAARITLTAIIATGLSIAAAWLSYRLIEQPSIRAARYACRMLKSRMLKAEKDHI